MLTAAPFIADKRQNPRRLPADEWINNVWPAILHLSAINMGASYDMHLIKEWNTEQSSQAQKDKQCMFYSILGS